MCPRRSKRVATAIAIAATILYCASIHADSVVQSLSAPDYPPIRISAQDGYDIDDATMLFVGENYMWIGTTGGVLRIPLDSGIDARAEPVAMSGTDLVVPTAGIVNDIRVFDNHVWIATSGFLYRCRQELNSKAEVVFVADMRRLEEAAGFLWVTNKFGVLRWSTDPVGVNNPIQIKPTSDGVWHVAAFKEYIWYLTRAGLFRAKVESPAETELIRTTFNTGYPLDWIEFDGHLWVSYERGLFRWTPDEAGDGTYDWMGRELQHASTLYEFGEFLWMDTNKGLGRYSAGAYTENDPEYFDILSVNQDAFHSANGSLWISVDSNLYRWIRGEKGNKESFQKSVGLGLAGKLYDLLDFAGYVWAATEFGLYRSNPGAPQSNAFEQIDLGIKYAVEIQVVADQLWMRSKDAVFRFRYLKDGWNAKISDPDLGAKQIETDDTIAPSWKLTGYQANTTPDLVDQRIYLYRRGEAESPVDGFPVPVERGKFQHAFRVPEEPGHYELVIEAEDLMGNTARSKPVPLPVGVEWDVTDALKWIGTVLGAVYFVVVLGLLIGARRSAGCFEWLTDPTFRKAWAYVAPVLRRSAFLKRWLLERYFQQLKTAHGSDEPYGPVPIEGPDTAPTTTADMLDAVRARGAKAWVRGTSGAGKTAMMRHLLRLYLSEPTLGDAWKKYGFIPIWIPLRETPGATVPELAHSALRRAGIVFPEPSEDGSYFKSLLEADGFLLMLDGVNESPHGDAIAKYATVAPRMRMLVTSQTAPEVNAFDRYTLPRLSEQLVGKLLKLYLGEERGSDLIADLPDDVRREIDNGYDVRLLIDLVRDGASTPRSRIDLYDTALIVATDPSDRPVLAKLAWDHWTAGTRRFKPDDTLTGDRLEALADSTVPIVVRRGAGEYEFTHDRMRGYLAARYALREAPSMDATLARLAGEEVWASTPAEQQSVHCFLAELTRDASELAALGQFAGDDVAFRQVLLSSVQTTAVRRGWRLNVRIGAGAETRRRGRLTGGRRPVRRGAPPINEKPPAA